MSKWPLYITGGIETDVYVLHDAIVELKVFLGHPALSKEAYYQL